MDKNVKVGRSKILCKILNYM